MSKVNGKLFERLIVLNNKRQMPMVGLGTYGIKQKEVFDTALQCGYKHFDTASFYNNQK